MLQVVEVLQRVMPLPEWFTGLAVGLLLIGLPIVLATAASGLAWARGGNLQRVRQSRGARLEL